MSGACSQCGVTTVAQLGSRWLCVTCAMASKPPPARLKSDFVSPWAVTEYPDGTVTRRDLSASISRREVCGERELAELRAAGWKQEERE